MLQSRREAGGLAIYGPLARLAGVTGAEWSLFCPGMGIAADSCALLIALLDRPTAGSVVETVAVDGTEAALGTEVSPAPTADGAVAGTAGVIAGAVDSGGGRLQALSASKVTASATACMAEEGGSVLPCLSSASVCLDIVPPGPRGLAKAVLAPVEGLVAWPSATLAQWGHRDAVHSQSREEHSVMHDAAP